MPGEPVEELVNIEVASVEELTAVGVHAAEVEPRHYISDIVIFFK